MQRVAVVMMTMMMEGWFFCRREGGRVDRQLQRGREEDMRCCLLCRVAYRKSSR